MIKKEEKKNYFAHGSEMAPKAVRLTLTPLPLQLNANADPLNSF